MVLLRRSPRSHALLCCVYLRPSARLWCEMGWCLGLRHSGCRSQGGCAGSWAASVAGLPQDLSSPGPTPSCDVRWEELGHFCQEINCCMLLPRGCLPQTCISVVLPGVHTDRVLQCLTDPCRVCIDNGLRGQPCPIMHMPTKSAMAGPACVM